MYYQTQDYLMHYGVLGMKWGVRRYQNYDGSYTKAGMKRFNKSLTKYETSNARYKAAKKNGTSKTEITNSRMARKNAKRQLDKDYKHLKQDKMADKGKIAYSEGYTIRGNNRVANRMRTLGAVTLAAAANKTGAIRIGNEYVTSFLASVGATAVGTSIGLDATNIVRNKRLRAYYSHTSKY